MKKHTLAAASLSLMALIATSCVDRKTTDEKGAIRLEETQDDPAINDTETSATANNDMVEIAEAKGVINDYFDAFKRSAPREAFDMIDPTTNTMAFSKFSEENPNYEKITVTFEDGANVQKSGEDTTVMMPIRMSATDADGNIISKAGKATLIKKGAEDNPEYIIKSMDLALEDS